MSRRKIANLERDLEIAEAGYREQLIAALQRTAAGHWGLLGSNQITEAPDRAAAVELLALGEHIKDIRARLGITDAFELHEDFIAWRRRSREPHALGEPKLAEHFLEKLRAENT